MTSNEPLPDLAARNHVIKSPAESTVTRPAGQGAAAC